MHGFVCRYWDKVGAVGHYDYGSLTMARTLGSDPNQGDLKKKNLENQN